jgi:hypothetical protein
LAGLDLADSSLAEPLLVTEVGVAVDKTFAQIAEGPAVAANGRLPRQPFTRSWLAIGPPCMPEMHLGHRAGQHGICFDECCDLCCDACCGDC